MRCGLLRQRTYGPYGIAARKTYSVLATHFLPSLTRMQQTVCGRQTGGSAMRCGLLRQRTYGPYGIVARKAYSVLATQALPSFFTSRRDPNGSVVCGR